jgi:hypothetical protein
VVRDTQDTAFVIFAVVIGMGVGAGAPWVAVIGLVVVGVLLWLVNKYIPMAAPIKTILNVVVVVVAKLDQQIFLKMETILLQGN